MASEGSDLTAQGPLHNGQDMGQRGWDRQANMFILLSLWMQSFPRDELVDGGDNDRKEASSSLQRTGVVVVKDGRVVGLSCSAPERHVAPEVIASHGGDSLSGSQLYFSRKPCATCLRRIVYTGVSQINFWPGDPEVSLLRSVSVTERSQRLASHDDAPPQGDEEARLDATATERLNVRFLLEPPAPGLARFVDETSQRSDFMKRVIQDDPGVKASELFSRQHSEHLESLSRDFLVGTEEQHRSILTHMGLENLCREPCFTGLRRNMRELLGVLASVAAGVPLLQHGFYSSEEQQPPTAAETPPSSRSTSPHHQGVSQEVARHCIVQARLLSYLTEHPKTGVGAVIWAKGQGTGCRGTGRLYLLGCGYNTYPVDFPYTEQQDPPEKDLSIHAEQNALTFRTGDIKAWEPTMIFVTKCPCDECVALIRGAGFTHIYTTDQDSGKDKGVISYLRFGSLKGVRKFVWQKKGSYSSDFADGPQSYKATRRKPQSHKNYEGYFTNHSCLGVYEVK